MSLSLWLDLMGAKWHGRQDAQSALPDQSGPNPYYEYLARKGHRRAGAIHRRFLKLDLRNQQRCIQAETAQRQAQLDLPRLQAEADRTQNAYDLERARDQEEAQTLNPPGRAYVPVVLYWLLLALLIAGDAAISYSAFLTLGDLMPWLVAALSLMVVVAMVVIGHVIGDRFRHGHSSRWGKAGLILTVIAISLVMTLFREQAQQATAEATRSVEIGTIIIDGPTAAAPVVPAAPAVLESVSAFLMFLTITMMGIVVPAILAYYVERRPRLLKVVQAYVSARWARARLIAGQRRLGRAERRVAAARAERTSRHAQAQVRLDESRDDIYWLMSAYAQANMRRRGSQELPAGLQAKPGVPGREVLAALLLVLALASGCGAKAAQPEPGAVIVVLVDMTTSARADANSYMQNFTTVLNAAQSGDRIFVVPVTASFVPQIAASAALPAASANPVSDAKKLKEARTKLQADVAKLLQSERASSPGTAILAGIQKAGAIYKAEAEGPRTLVILSDMIEQGQLDFTTAALTPAGPVLDGLEQDGYLPRLEADVFVAGITAGQAQTYQVPQERFQAITQFWAAYFERAGARLGPYDRDLLNFTVKR